MALRAVIRGGLVRRRPSSPLPFHYRRARFPFRSLSSGVEPGCGSVAGSDFKPDSGAAEPGGLKLEPFCNPGPMVGTSGEGDTMLWDYPVGIVVSMLDAVHDLTGLPWWITISTSTLAFRAFLLPVLILQLKKTGQMAKMLPQLPPPLPPPLSGRSYREQYLLFQKERKKLGCPSYLWSISTFLVQFPCFLLLMASIRRMCLQHHPGFDSGGALWFQNLTDYPHGIQGCVFPLLIAGLHFTNVQISFWTFNFKSMQGILGLMAKYYKLYLDVLAIPLLFIGFHIPQGSLVYWATNSSLTLVQQLSLRSPPVRRILGLPEMNDFLNDKCITPPLNNNGAMELNISAERLSSKKLLDLALEEMAKGHQETAFPLLRIAVEKDPELIRGLVAIGQILFSQGLFVEATDYFERAISKVLTTTDIQEEIGLLVLAYFGAGVSHIWQGNKAEGIAHLKRISELREPDNSVDKACYYRGLVMLGSTLFREGEKAEASKYLRLAAAYDPSVEAYVQECEEGVDEISANK